MTKEELITFVKENCFTKTNKIDSNCSKIHWWENRNFTNVYEFILQQTSFISGNNSFRKRIYCLLNDVTKQPKCKICNKPITLFYDQTKGFGEYCGIACSNKNNVKVMSQKTCEKYGVDNPGKIPKAIQKRKEFNDNPEKVKKSIEQVKQTKLEKYGDENYNNNEQNKITCMQRYGVIHQSQLLEIHLKQFKFRWKEYILPSGQVIKIQGYEYKALDELLKNYNENEIITERNKIPTIWYEFENQKHRYYPDIFIPRDNLIIEVKSEYTFNLELNKNRAKFDATIKEGYNFKLMVY